VSIKLGAMSARPMNQVIFDYAAILIVNSGDVLGNSLVGRCRLNGCDLCCKCLELGA